MQFFQGRKFKAQDEETGNDCVIAETRSADKEEGDDITSSTGQANERILEHKAPPFVIILRVLRVSMVDAVEFAAALNIKGR
ncbi:hypothetical protein ElyMa_004276600 [Elysia marginata]|uniref:Uncharacterized protein n=1 Tax=Elysia marginata TaxID=1093978 RepID=A0AAV4GXJ6_9GAST|nr:hypothetical protein ElyMa_004276600 [Elysia marginata]